MLATDIPKLGQRIKIDWTTKSDQLLYVCIENVHYGKFKDKQEVKLVVKLFNNNSHFYFVTDIFTNLERKYPFELYIFLFFNESFPLFNHIGESNKNNNKKDRRRNHWLALLKQKSISLLFLSCVWLIFCKKIKNCKFLLYKQ